MKHNTCSVMHENNFKVCYEESLTCWDILSFGSSVRILRCATAPNRIIASLLAAEMTVAGERE